MILTLRTTPNLISVRQRGCGLRIISLMLYWRLLYTLACPDVPTAHRSLPQIPAFCVSGLGCAFWVSRKEILIFSTFFRKSRFWWDF